MKKGLPQEALRAVALLTMLIDHVGYALLPRMYVLRGIGRLAFPIFAFLLAEGAEHTKNPKKYILRLGIAALISELPFDFMISRWIDWDYQNVILTFFFGILAIFSLKYTWEKGALWKLLGCLGAGACTLAAEACKMDYGAFGVLCALMFWLFWNRKLGPVICAAGFVGLCFWLMEYNIPGTNVPLETLGVLSVPLMCLYKGWRASRNKALQWTFYLFYPVHMAVIAILAMM